MTPDLATLPVRLREKRGRRSLRGIAPEIGVGFSTLARVEHGVVPSGRALAAIERWLAGPEGERNGTSQQPDDAIRHIFRIAEQDIRSVVGSERNAQDLADHYRVLADDQRGRITALEQQVSEARADAALLTAIRVALGVEEDADLVEEVRCIRVESEGRRVALEQVSEERRVEWQRAERAEAEYEQLSAGIALACAYKTAVEKLDGVADAEAALFAWLGEVNAQSR